MGEHYYSRDFYAGPIGTIGTGLSVKTFGFHPFSYAPPTETPTRCMTVWGQIPCSHNLSDVT